MMARFQAGAAVVSPCKTEKRVNFRELRPCLDRDEWSANRVTFCMHSPIACMFHHKPNFAKNYFAIDNKGHDVTAIFVYDERRRLLAESRNLCLD